MTASIPEEKLKAQDQAASSISAVETKSIKLLPGVKQVIVITQDPELKAKLDAAKQRT